MLLAVDAGNTEITLGCMQGMDCVATARLEMRRGSTEYEYGVLIERILGLKGVALGGFEGAVLASVVPPVTPVLRNALRLAVGCDPLVIAAGVKTGLNIGIDDPSQLGADLVASAVAAIAGRQPPVIVIDLGTATTLTVIGKNSRVLGGAIIPGIRVSLEALSGTASLLPEVAFSAPRRCIGTNTSDCMRSGAVFGTAAAIDGMIERMEEELGEEARLIATGSGAASIIPHCKRVMEIDEQLHLRGLALIWERNRRARRA